MHKVFLFLLLIGLLWTSPAAGNSGAKDLFRSSLESASPKKSMVVVVEDAEATRAFQAREERVREMVAKGLQLTFGETNSPAIWHSLISTQDVIGIKVYTAPGPLSGTRPAVVAAVIQEMLQAGIPARNIYVWDKHLRDLRQAGYEEISQRFGVRLAGSANEGFDDQVFYETPLLGQLVWGDHEFGKKGEGIGRKSYLSKLVTQKLTKIISIAPLLFHNDASVAGHLYGLAIGSVDNCLRFDGNASRLAIAVPEIFGMSEIADKVVLNITDALVCQYLGQQGTWLHYSLALNQLRFSRDPVALDVYSIYELEHQRQLVQVPAPKPNFELLENAALIELGIRDERLIQLERVRRGTGGWR